MRYTKKLLSVLFVFTLIFQIFLTAAFPVKAEAAKKAVNIVIDPGHGGEGERNLGAQYNGLSEKELTLQLANALVTELSKYDNVNVYITRTTDTIMSLDSRAEYAKSVGADFVYSIHFNASLEHDFYGSEVWSMISMVLRFGLQPLAPITRRAMISVR